jgi:hypothetical protein
MGNQKKFDNYSALSLRWVGVPVARVFVAMDGDNKRSGMTKSVP